MPEPSPDLARAWRRAVVAVRGLLAGPAFDLWIGDVAPTEYRNGVVHLSVPNAFVEELMRDRYADPLRDALCEAVGEPLEVRFAQREAARLPVAAAPRRDGPLYADGEHSHEVEFAGSPLNPRFTFETFVVGPSNRFPQAAAQAVSRAPAKQYNPLFLWGGVGLGKTHLMQAIGWRFQQLNPEAQVVYVSAETFLYHYVSSVREDRTAEFRRRYRNVDLWLVDDIQFIASRESTRTEAEFFHTFNALYETSKQIVVTSDRPPKELLIDDRLRSRFEWGLITDIKAPDIETRLAILQKRAEEDHVHVPNEVMMHIAQMVRDSIRVLEGALVKVIATASLLHEEVTIELARECLRDYTLGERSSTVDMETIQQTVAQHFGVEPAALTGKSRRAEIVVARQVAMYLCRQVTNQSYADIGQQFGRDHSTVMYACSKIADLLGSEDADVSAAVSAIGDRLDVPTGD